MTITRTSGIRWLPVWHTTEETRSSHLWPTSGGSALFFNQCCKQLEVLSKTTLFAISRHFELEDEDGRSELLSSVLSGLSYPMKKRNIFLTNLDTWNIFQFLYPLRKTPHLGTKNSTLSLSLAEKDYSFILVEFGNITVGNQPPLVVSSCILVNQYNYEPSTVYLLHVTFLVLVNSGIF